MEIYQEGKHERGDVGDNDDLNNMAEPQGVSTVLGAISDALTCTPVDDPWSRSSLVFAAANVGLYILDYVMDILVVYWLARETDIAVDWVYLTSAIIVIPLVLVNIFSVVWYHEDHTVHIGGFCPRPEQRSLKEKLLLLLGHSLLVGPVVRQFEIMKIG